MSQKRKLSQIEKIMLSKEILQQFIAENIPGYKIYPVSGDSDGLCMISSLSISLSHVLKRHVTNKDVENVIRKEAFENQGFYVDFAPGVNILEELENFLKNPLKFYGEDTCDLFLMMCGNGFNANTVIFQSDEEKAWIVNLAPNDKEHSTTLYFGRSVSLHVDPVLPINFVMPSLPLDISHSEDAILGIEGLTDDTDRGSPDSSDDCQVIKTIPNPKSPDSSDDDDCQIIKTIQNRRSSISNEDDDCQVIEPIPNQRSSSSTGDGDCQVIETSTVKNERMCMAYLNDDKRYPLWKSSKCPLDTSPVADR